MKKLETIIGLEIHVQLKTKSKMFCSCNNDSESVKPNTTICPICLGHPGVLPIPNKQAFLFAIKAGLALNGTIANSTKFDRKNYFYPDLPKAYQISQFDEPIMQHGFLEIFIDEKTLKRFNITRLHLEEDAAKNIHKANETLVDFNRGGTPLIEIVTEPDFRSPLEAKLFLQELRAIMRYLNVSDADMEKGHLRCDANISLRPEGEHALYPKTEIKNINSFRAVEKALEYEIARQTELWNTNTPQTISSTRGWDEDKQKTIEQRTKEASHDYRYFPEPDIPRIEIDAQEIEKIRALLPELPIAKRRRLHQEYGLPFETINQIVLDKLLVIYFESVVSELHDWLNSLNEPIKKNRQEKISKLATGWLLGKMPPLLEKYSITYETLEITPENFAEFLSLIYKEALTAQSALKILEIMVDPKTKDRDPSHIMEEQGLAQIDNRAEIEDYARKIIDENQKQVEQFRQGKIEVINFLLGQLMRVSKGKANPQSGKEILEKLLNE